MLDQHINLALRGDDMALPQQKSSSFVIDITRQWLAYIDITFACAYECTHGPYFLTAIRLSPWAPGSLFVMDGYRCLCNVTYNSSTI